MEKKLAKKLNKMKLFHISFGITYRELDTYLVMNKNYHKGKRAMGVHDEILIPKGFDVAVSLNGIGRDIDPSGSMEYDVRKEDKIEISFVKTITSKGHQVKSEKSISKTRSGV